ncbi:hypothetical protein GE061_007522 [Apolygus lucorum]|uniref:Uncharacterized protein n=1 Tax=Apolygus lucorum TaxID=248454 RepID=A0A6A4J0G9_APOLU|nr:hypothetical protein GE061_007522 [Apolygus lucorum]
MASAFSFLLVVALTGIMAVWVEGYDFGGYPNTLGYQNPYTVNNRVRRYGGNYPVSSFRIPILSDIYDFFARIINYILGDYIPYSQPIYPPYRH